MCKKKKGRLTMRTVREVIRLIDMGLSSRKIARSISISPTTVSYYKKHFIESGLGCDEITKLDDDQVKDKLRLERKDNPRKPLPDMTYIHKQLSQKGVTIKLLWEEYKQENDLAYEYSQFASYYRDFKSKLHPTARFNHKMGEKVFVDFSGYRPTIVDPITGQRKQVELFVGVLGASGYTYARACFSQNLENWIDCHVRMFEYFGGTPETVVPDNLKSAVTKASYTSFKLNPTYTDMANHYGVYIDPARPYKPKDKSKVENGVLNVQRSILAPLRNRVFFSIEELNKAITALLEVYNSKQMRILKKSRRELFEEERKFLKPIVEPYKLTYWKTLKLGLDYHINVEDTFYSVPYTYIHKRIDVAYSANLVRVYYNSTQIASHKRVFVKGQFVTQEDHKPKNHQHVFYSIDQILNKASNIGPNTISFIQSLLSNKKNPKASIKASLNTLRLAKAYSEKRLEAACTKAVSFSAYKYGFVKNLLEKNLETDPIEQRQINPTMHSNIRGSDYFIKEVESQ